MSGEKMSSELECRYFVAVHVRVGVWINWGSASPIVGGYPAFCWTHCSFHCVLNISPKKCMFAFAGIKAALTSTSAFAHMLQCCSGNVCGCGKSARGGMYSPKASMAL